METSDGIGEKARPALCITMKLPAITQFLLTVAAGHYIVKLLGTSRCVIEGMTRRLIFSKSLAEPAPAGRRSGLGQLHSFFMAEYPISTVHT